MVNYFIPFVYFLLELLRRASRGIKGLEKVFLDFSPGEINQFLHVKTPAALSF